MNIPIIFLHVPKAGGSTVVSAIRRYLMARGKESSLHIDFNDPKFHKRVYSKKNIRKNISDLGPEFVCGHIRYDPLISGCWLSMIREPISWLISWFYYTRSHPEIKPKVPVPANMAIEEFVELLPTKWSYVRNYQIKYFSNESNIDQAVGLIDTEQIVVGCMEYFDKSMILFSKVMNLDKILYSEKINVGSYSPPSEALCKKIGSLMEIDIEFYSRVMCLFDLKLKKYRVTDDDAKYYDLMKDSVTNGFKKIVEGKRLLFWCATDVTRCVIRKLFIRKEDIAGIMDRKAPLLREKFSEYQVIDSNKVQSLPEHDMCIIVNELHKDEIMQQARRLGAQNIVNYNDYVSSRAGISWCCNGVVA